MKKVILFIFSVLIAQILFSQELNKDLRQQAIEIISQSLIEKYVYPEIGQKCADLIRKNMAAGEYEKFVLKDKFAGQLTDDLYSIAGDKHLRVRIRPPLPGDQEQIAPEVEDFYRRLRYREFNDGFFAAQVLEGNIGYIELRSFSGAVNAKSVADAAFKIIENTDALIIDLRRNGGGSPAMVQYICSYFFSKKVHLNSLYWREGNRTVEYWTIEVAGKKRPNVPLFILTSGDTFSGAEEFAYNMKTRKRATIIGEVTGGGANPGGGVPVLEDIIVFIPTGRAVNPVTNTNWEGTGVIPDIETDANSAYDKALEMALKAAQKYKNNYIAKGKMAVLELQRVLKETENKLKLSGRNEVYNELKLALNAATDAGISDEFSINALGYRYLSEEKNELSVLIFEFNAEKFPQSSNVYDSLGEAFMKNGETDLAIQNYKKSLELNPLNKNAVTMLKKMGVDFPDQ